ncbi:PAS domain S-box protein [Deinococcus humi]|uniref:PAS domain S-box-containing protein n=1 Tax=Deinococcus humi TaxID=662880 RepID=A0A7W8JTC8_9DEIO|nr:PAS domain S-box protein [Deinococcus humi]MBB5362870.1 PAS domain S-box-containing protein [Deinococcus humi]
MPNLRRVAWGALATIALIGVWSNAVLERDTSELLTEVSVMNIMGRQRVYAEEVARHAWQLVTALPVEDRKQARTRLKGSVAGMREGHGAWVKATALNDPQMTVSPLYSRLDVEVQGYLAAANSILLTPDQQLRRRNSDVRWLEEQATGSLIRVLDEAITALEDHGEAHIRSMNATARLRLACVIVLLFILGQWVFRPLDRRIRRVQGELVAERDFAQQVMTTAQGITVTDLHDRFEYVNPAFARMLGMAPDALLGCTPFDVTVSEEHSRVREALQRRATGETTAYETRLRRMDGEAVPVLITGAPRVVGGLLMGSIASVTDLTEQKRNEQTVRILATLSHSLEQEQTPKGVARQALNLLAQSMELSWLALYRRDRDQFVPQATSGGFPADRESHSALALGPDEGPIWDTLGGCTVYLSETCQPPLTSHGAGSVALVPLPSGEGTVTQVLCAIRLGEARLWEPWERVLLETAAQSVSTALQRAELHMKAQDAAAFAQTLLAISALVESDFDPAATAAEVLNLLGPALGMSRASVLVVRDEQVRWSPHGHQMSPLQASGMSRTACAGR